MIYLATILLASILVPPLVCSSAWNDPTSSQYHIQTDEGPERYFRYQTQNGQYRKEKRLQDGTVIGTYAWIDDNGYLRQRDYIADNQGYRIVKNKNVYVGRNANVGDAVKATKRISNNYIPPNKLNTATQVPDRKYIAVTPKPIYSLSGVSPLVELSLNSIPSSTPAPILPESTSLYSSSSINTNDIEGRFQVSGSPSSEYIPSSTLNPPVPVYLPSSTTAKPPTVYIPSENNVYSSVPGAAPPIHSIYSSTIRPPSSTYLPYSSTPKPPTAYIPPKNPTNIYIPPVQYPAPSLSTESPISSTSYTPPISSSTYLPPSLSYSPSLTPKPFSPPPSIYLPSSTPPPDTYLPPSSPRPFVISSTPSPIYVPPATHSPLYPSNSNILSTPSSNYLPSSTPDYVSITSPPRNYIPQSQAINSNSLEYSGSPQYEHYQDNFVNPYIHQNGPTYPIDTRGHSFNPSYNNIGNGYDPQYPFYDGISVTNDGFRYYIPKAYHEEQQSRHGEKSGSFGYIDPFGIRRVIYYNAGPEGFKHRKNNRYVGFNATPYDPRPY